MDPRVQHLNIIIDESFALEDELQRLNLRIYPSLELKELIDTALIPINRDLRQLFIEESEAIVNDPLRNVAINVLAAHVLWMSGRLSLIVKGIEGADIKSHPLEIMTAIRFWLENLEHSDYCLMTSPLDELNFGVEDIWSGLAKYLKLGVQVDPRIERRYVNLIFPRMHKNNVLLSGIYVHELGHYVDRSAGLWEEVFTEVAALDPTLSRLDDKVLDPQTLSPMSGVKLLSALHDGILGSWIREIVADTFGIFLLGPAFFFSANIIDSRDCMAETIKGRPPKVPVAPTHPSTAFRVKYRTKLLEEHGYLESLPTVLQDQILQISLWWESSERHYYLCRDEGIRSRDSQDAFVYDMIEQILSACIPAITGKVLAKVAGSKFEPKQMLTAQQLAEHRLAYLIPPNELDGQPADPATILNAGWCAFYMSKDAIQQRLQRFEGRRGEYDLVEAINGLLRHALLASHVQRRWNKL